MRLDVIFACTSNCVVSLISTCLYYTELHTLDAYPAFVTQLNTLMALATSGLVLLVLAKHKRSPAPDVNLLRWLQISVLLALQNTLEVASIQRIGNDDLPPILQQAAVPLTLALSALLLRAHYNRWQLLGSFLVVAGVLVGFLPVALQSEQRVSMAWALVFLLSRLPQAGASVLAEEALSGRRDVAWPFRATLYTSLLGLPLNLFSSLLLSPWAPESVWDDYAGGARCLARPASLEQAELCGSAWRSVLLFALPGMLYNATEYLVVQRASASTYFLLAALQLPLQEMLLSWGFIMGSLRSEFSFTFAIALLIIVPGLVLFGFGAEQGQSQESEMPSAPTCLLNGRHDAPTD